MKIINVKTFFILTLLSVAFIVSCGKDDSETPNNDTTSPTFTISSGEFYGTSASPFQVTITFSEAISNFEASAVSVSNGTAALANTSGNAYTLNITPTTFGQVTVDVDAGAVADAAGNGNQVGDAFSIGYYNTTDDISTLVSKFYSSDVTLSVQMNSVTATTKDLPDHKSHYYHMSNPLYEEHTTQNDPAFDPNPGTIGEQNIVFTLPRFPEEASNKQGPGLGAMGVAINSVVFYNQEAGPGDDIFEEIATFDQWEGHPAMDEYHYHIETPWLTDGSNPNKVDASAFMGFLQDGFPVYGPMENGAAVTNDILDDYHGHIGPTADFPNGIYHYHITDEFPWINGDAFYGTPGTQTE